MKKFILAIASCIAFFAVEGQQYYPIFTQNYSNPFLVNPSLITMSRKAELNATFRQQWTGVQDAPETMQLDFQYPFDPRISVGLNVYNDKSVLLSSSGALATFGYKVRLSSKYILGFGLSGGFVSNQIDLKNVPDVDLVDPVLLNSNNNFDFDGQFGIHFRHRNFVVGGSLLKLVDNRPFKEGSVQSQKFDPFKDRAGFMTYYFHLSPAVSIQPVLYYRSVLSGYEYFEGSVLMNYKNVFTLGGGYRTELGPHVLLRVRFKNVEAGFSHDLPSNRYGGSTGGTNEVQLKIQFGMEREPLEMFAKEDESSHEREKEVSVARADEPVNGTQVVERTRTSEASVEPGVVQRSVSERTTSSDRLTPERTTSERNASEPDQRVAAERSTSERSASRSSQNNQNIAGAAQPVEQATRPANDRISDIPEEAFTGDVSYELVVGAYQKKAHAEKYLREVISLGYKGVLRTSRESEYFYVILPEYATKAITLERVIAIRDSTPFKDAWFRHFK